MIDFLPFLSDQDNIVNELKIETTDTKIQQLTQKTSSISKQKWKQKWKQKSKSKSKSATNGSKWTHFILNETESRSYGVWNPLIRSKLFSFFTRKPITFSHKRNEIMPSEIRNPLTFIRHNTIALKYNDNDNNDNDDNNSIRATCLIYSDNTDRNGMSGIANIRRLVKRFKPDYIIIQASNESDCFNLFAQKTKHPFSYLMYNNLWVFDKFISKLLPTSMANSILKMIKLQIPSIGKPAAVSFGNKRKIPLIAGDIIEHIRAGIEIQQILLDYYENWCYYERIGINNEKNAKDLKFIKNCNFLLNNECSVASNIELSKYIRPHYLAGADIRTNCMAMTIKGLMNKLEFESATESGFESASVDKLNDKRILVIAEDDVCSYGLALKLLGKDAVCNVVKSVNDRHIGLHRLGSYLFEQSMMNRSKNKADTSETNDYNDDSDYGFDLINNVTDTEKSHIAKNISPNAEQLLWNKYEIESIQEMDKVFEK